MCYDSISFHFTPLCCLPSQYKGSWNNHLFVFDFYQLYYLLLLFGTGNERDGPLRLCLLVILAHLGGCCYHLIIPSHSFVWDDVSVWFFLEEQFCGCICFVLPVWTQHGENLAGTVLALPFTPSAYSSLGLYFFFLFLMCNNFFWFRLAWPSCYLLSLVNHHRRQLWASPYLLWALWLRHDSFAHFLGKVYIEYAEDGMLMFLFLSIIFLIAARGTSRISLHR